MVNQIAGPASATRSGRGKAREQEDVQYPDLEAQLAKHRRQTQDFEKNFGQINPSSDQELFTASEVTDLERVRTVDQLRRAIQDQPDALVAMIDRLRMAKHEGHEMAQNAQELLDQVDILRLEHEEACQKRDIHLTKLNKARRDVLKLKEKLRAQREEQEDRGSRSGTPIATSATPFRVKWPDAPIFTGEGNPTFRG